MNLSERQIEIIKVALHLVGDKGLENLTTKRIAEEMTFSEAAIYRHFKNKNEIIIASLTFYNQTLQNEIENILRSNSSSLDKLLLIIDFQFKFFTKTPAVIMMIFSETSMQYCNELSDVVSEIIQNKSKKVSELIENGQNENVIRKDVEASQVANMFLGAMRFTVLKWKLSDYQYDLMKEGKKLKKTFKNILVQ